MDSEPTDLLNQLWVIIPAYNESTRIKKVLNNLKQNGFRNVVVIDDGSTDNTKEVAKSIPGIYLVSHSINMGAGAATKTGLDFAKQKNAEYAITIDADGQHSPTDIFKLLKYAKKYDLVIGSRMIGKNLKNMPKTRILFNKIGSLVTFLYYRVYVHDSQSGFKLFSKKAINNIQITFNGFEFCSEMIGEIKRNDLTFKEVPIRIIYSKDTLEKEHGQSFLKGVKMVIKMTIKKILLGE